LWDLTFGSGRTLTSCHYHEPAILNNVNQSYSWM
jgi:hypothetical protein